MDLKPATTICEQMELMKERGCVINSDAACFDFLSKVNYYRLTAYFLPFRNADHSYKDGTTFEKIVGLYEFDQKLRALIFTAVEEIEICTRARLAYYHGHRYGALGYNEVINFNERHKPEIFKSLIESEIDRNNNTLWVKHYQTNYAGKFPIWVIIELFSLGMLSRFYSDLHLEDRKQIANEFGTKELYLRSWLRALTVVRNTCAHYGRMYYTMFTNLPKIPSYLGVKHTGKLFDQLLMLKLLAPNPASWNSTHLVNLSALFDEYSEYIELSHIGFIDKWESLLRTATSCPKSRSISEDNEFKPESTK